jgi:hypothetical protein
MWQYLKGVVEATGWRSRVSPYQEFTFNLNELASFRQFRKLGYVPGTVENF